MKIFALALLILGMVSFHALAQEYKYAPYPQDYEQLDPQDKHKAQQDIQRNTAIYFHSQAYRDAINGFVQANNPDDIQSCRLLTVGREKDRSKTTIIKPLIFAYTDDLHPTVGEWEQAVIVTGCRREFNFTMVGSADKSGTTPVMTLKY